MTKEQREQLKKEMDSLPRGGITYKTINNTPYAYYQWQENGCIALKAAGIISIGNVPDEPGICITTRTTATALPTCLKHAASI